MDRKPSPAQHKAKDLAENDRSRSAELRRMLRERMQEERPQQLGRAS